MRIWIAMVVAVALAVGCGKKKTRDESASDEAKQSEAPEAARSLWDLAPAGSVGGVVFQPGSIETLYAYMGEVRRIAGADPLLGPALEQGLAKELEDSNAPFDLWSLEAVERDGGIDPGKGVAAFFDAEGEVLLAVPPVADMAGLAKFMGEPTQKMDGRQVIKGNHLVCADAGGRVLCAPTLEAVDAAGNGGAKLTDKVPDRARGDVEIIVDLARIPKASAGLSEVIRNPGKLAVGVRAERGVLALNAHLVGQLVLPGAASKPPALPVDELARDASGLVRVHWDAQAALKLAPVPPSLPVPETSFDARKSFLDQLTGEVVVATMTGGDGGGFRAEIGLKDPVPLRRSLPELCGVADKQIPQLRFEIQKGYCAAEFDVPAVPNLPPGLTPSGRMRAVIEVTGDGLRVTVGDPESPGSVPPVSRHVAGFQSEPAMLAGWGRSFDPLAALDADARKALDSVVANKADARQRAIIRAVRWIAAHVAEIGFSVRLEDGGVGLSLTVTTFAADPKDVYAAYEAAVTKDLDGDHAGYRAAMKALASKRDTLAGAQAATVERGGPAFGFTSGVLAAIAIPAFMKYQKKAEMAGAFEEIKRIYEDVDAPTGTGAR